MWKIKNHNFINWCAVISGHVLERYEVMAFTFFVPILTPLFFPVEDAHLSNIAAMVTFGAGYWARPLGGILFGHIGDRFGRKTALFSSMLCVTFPTLAISCIPTYSVIGIWASIVLLSCRVIQGISVGGEYSGATVYFFEYSKESQQGFSGSIMSATAFLGGLVATLVASLCIHWCSSELAWRFPFLVGGIASLITFFLRRKVAETPVFQKIVTKRNYPIIDLIRKKKTQMLTGIIVGGQGHIILYSLTMYFNSIILKNHNISSSHIMLMNSSILAFWIVLILIFGKIADKFDKKQILSTILIGSAIIAPFPFWLVNHTFSFVNLILLEVTLSIFGAGMYTITASYLPLLFKPEERYSGVAVSQTFGQAIFGGTAPLIATYFSYWTGDILAPLPLLVCNASLGAFLVLKEIQNKKMQNFETLMFVNPNSNPELSESRF